MHSVVIPVPMGIASSELHASVRHTDVVSASANGESTPRPPS